MQDSFLIKYDYKDAEGFNLAVLGESFVGFDALLKDILNLAQLSEESVEVRTTRVQRGSVEVYNAIIVSLQPVPFDSIPAFLDFLRIAAPQLVNDANTFFSVAHDAHRAINDYFARNQFDGAIVSGIIAGYVVEVVKKVGALKKHPQDTQGLTPTQLSKLQRMVEGGRYRRAFSPIVEGGVSAIRIATVGVSAQRDAVITEQNVGDYLPEDSKILPDLINGQLVSFTGKLVGLQSTRGASMKLKIDSIDPRYALLIAVPADNTTIEQYASFFNQHVVIEAEVSRKTLYKKPELIVRKMSLNQGSLLNEGSTEEPI